ncbi:MAG: hypothetical protein M1817_003247 [Caeruleum heppii]|nr:MAG: hypothetical protein M1817_003247 [Caeruleum heppii]
MRLLLLPISTRRSLLYCQRITQAPSDQSTLIDKATARASKLWIQWEKGERKWQKSVTEYGNKLLHRIPYEEWGLKSIPPLSAQRRADEIAGQSPVDVAFPSTIISPERVEPVMRALATERQALHRKRMWWSIVGMPISAPVALVPISLEKALSGSKHIEFLLDHKLIRGSPSPTLDDIYNSDSVMSGNESTNGKDMSDGLMKDVDSQAADPDGGEATAERMLLQESHGKRMAEVLEVPELAVEIERAVWQVRRALKEEEQAKARTPDSVQEGTLKEESKAR